MIKAQDNFGLRVVVVASEDHKDQESQRHVGQRGAVIDHWVKVPKVRLDSGKILDFHVNELEVEAPVFTVGGWAERTSHPYAKVTVGSHRKVLSIGAAGIRIVGDDGGPETWAYDFCRPSSGPAGTLEHPANPHPAVDLFKAIVDAEDALAKAQVAYDAAHQVRVEARKVLSDAEDRVRVSKEAMMVAVDKARGIPDAPCVFRE